MIDIGTGAPSEPRFRARNKRVPALINDRMTKEAKRVLFRTDRVLSARCV
jgi:hypothetical protein